MVSRRNVLSLLGAAGMAAQCSICFRLRVGPLANFAVASFRNTSHRARQQMYQNDDFLTSLR